MRVLASKGKRVPMKDLTRTLNIPDSTTESYEAERIREERQLAEYLDQLENQNAGSADAFANVTPQDDDLLQKIAAEMEMEWTDFDISSIIHPALDGSLDYGLVEALNAIPHPKNGFSSGSSGYVEVTNTNVAPSEYEMGSGSEQNLAGPFYELQLLKSQAKMQHQMILKLQEQVRTLTVIHQQNQQKLVEGEQRKQTHANRESAGSAVKGCVSIQMLSNTAETQTVSMNNLTPLSVSGQFVSSGLDSMDGDIYQCNKENIERPDDEMNVDAEKNRQLGRRARRLKRMSPVNNSNNSLRNEVRSSIRAKSCNAKKALNVREKSKAYTREECNKQFRHKSKFIDRLRAHTGGKSFVCKDCDVAFKYKSYLTRHQIIHTGETPFKCLVCSLAFNDKSNLSKHLMIHTNEKPFICDICDRSFRQKRNLSMHLMIHTNEKPFICDICDRSFRHKVNLLRHIVTIHNGEKPHKCNVCKKTFRQRSILSRHLKVHANKE